MDTNDIAARLGTTPRNLRAFLRSGYSTFQSVGSGARYDFTPAEVQTIERRFSEWRAAGKPKPDTGKRKKSSPPKPSRDELQAKYDREVWEEEGPVVLEDIRDPKVRARVLRDAKAAEDRLAMMLMAAGRHVSQLGDRRVS